MTSWLVDTGPLVAYLDASDSFHRSVAATFDAFRGRLITSSAVVTEAMHFVSRSRDGPRYLHELMRACEIGVYDLCRDPERGAAVALMERYADTPMDFADATLVLLAEATRVADILTLDRQGFATFRTRTGKGFRLVLEG